MFLRVSHRLLLLNILPQVGDFATLRIVRDLQTILSFTEEELKAKDISRNGDDFVWKEEADKPVDIPIGEIATNIIADRLKELDSRKQLRAEFLPLYEHFVNGDEWEERPHLEVLGDKSV